MQRLYSSFAAGWPGAGILLLRLIAAAGLLCNGIASAHAVTGVVQAIPPIGAAASGLLLIVGLFTPLAGVAAGVIEAVIAFSGPGFGWPQTALAGLSLSLAMIGPGAWSLDARLFGRKQIDVEL
jgi:putative oxidoreductase